MLCILLSLLKEMVILFFRRNEHKQKQVFVMCCWSLVDFCPDPQRKWRFVTFLLPREKALVIR